MQSTIQDGSADAFVVPMDFPDPRITAALSSGDMTIYSTPKEVFEGEAFAKITNLPGTVAFTIPISEMGYRDGVSVISEDDIYRGPGTVGGDIVNVTNQPQSYQVLDLSQLLNVLGVVWCDLEHLVAVEASLRVTYCQEDTQQRKLLHFPVLFSV